MIVFAHSFDFAAAAAAVGLTEPSRVFQQVKACQSSQPLLLFLRLRAGAQ